MYRDVSFCVRKISPVMPYRRAAYALRERGDRNIVGVIQFSGKSSRLAYIQERLVSHRLIAIQNRADGSPSYLTLREFVRSTLLTQLGRFSTALSPKVRLRSASVSHCPNPNEPENDLT